MTEKGHSVRRQLRREHIKKSFYLAISQSAIYEALFLFIAHKVKHFEFSIEIETVVASDVADAVFNIPKLEAQNLRQTGKNFQEGFLLFILFLLTGTRLNIDIC